MPIKIYDSLTKKKVEFSPLEPGKIKLYSCGVTVYDECHIGHARSLYIFDVIKRYLKYRNFDVTFVRNITDIDDKIINKAKELGISAKEIAEKYIASYKEDLKALQIEEADFEPRATENIPEMIKHIDALIEKGFAYEVSGDVYFSVRQFKDYGKLSGQSIEQMLEAVRIEKDPKKKDPLDFALWKKSKEDEPSWDSPWGKGRPGWHIECSVMSSKFLKTQTLDIHAGGRDLIFPHHENEIAQSEALTGKPFAKYWIHHGLLTINGQKMSKSLGNFVTIQEALKKYHPDVLKLFYLQSHYSSPIDFSDKKMQEVIEYYRSLVLLFRFYKENLTKYGEKSLKEAEIKELNQEYHEKFTLAMDDDFNTPIALSVISRAKSGAFSLTANFELQDNWENWARFQYLIKIIGGLLSCNFGIYPDRAGIEEDKRLLTGDVRELHELIDAGVQDLRAWKMEQSKQIEQLRREKKFVEADKIKEELRKKGFKVLDRKGGKTEIL